LVAAECGKHDGGVSGVLEKGLFADEGVEVVGASLLG
jgi:hypothetical protein